MNIWILLLPFVFSQEQLSLITYNLSMNGRALHRLPNIISELKKLNADVLCLQGVYETDLLIKKMNYKYVHYYNSPEIFFSHGVCPLTEIFKTKNPFWCRIRNCADVTQEALLKCLAEKCQVQLERLKNEHNECAQAFTSHVKGHAFVDIFDLFNPFSAIPKFTEKGSNGLLLLSKLELKNQEYSDFSEISTQENNGALIADIADYRIICAKTSSPLGRFIYTGPFKSLEEENKVQIEKLKKWLAEENNIVMGNLNCSKSIPFTDIKGNFPHNCAELESSGLKDALYNKPECTYCPYNNLVEFQDLGGLILDNLFVSPESLIDVDIIMKSLTPMNSFLSDHFGVRARIKTIEP